MNKYHFISYSRATASEFTLKLCDALKAGPPSHHVWLDRRELQAGQEWDIKIPEAIGNCDSLLFVMTQDSVEDHSICKKEWAHALKYKKPIIPLKLHSNAELPFRINALQYIDFTGDFDVAMAQLRNHLEWRQSPYGILQSIKDLLVIAQYDYSRAIDTHQIVRIQKDISEFEKQIEKQQQIVDNPQGAADRVEESIERGFKRERRPEKSVGGIYRSKFINPPPGEAPSYFQDRSFETKLIGDFLRDGALRLMMIVGRGGVGKTALVCRLLKALESSQLPDDGGPFLVDGIVYLSGTGTHRLTLPNLYADLSRLLPDEKAKELDALYKNPQVSTEAKMQELLDAFPTGRVVVLLDNFEDVVNPEIREVGDNDLAQALHALLNLPHHAVKVIITTRIPPYDIALVQSGRQTRIDLDEGLLSPFAENILREMDKDGTVGLKSAPDKLLDEARERTRGYPRALEALFAILSADRDTSLREILDDTRRLLPENVVEALVGEAFSRLDSIAQKVMQALAIYGRPVPPVAIDFLLQPYLLGVDSVPILSRLVNMKFVRKEAGRYYLHPVDREYALSRIARGTEADRANYDEPPFTQIAMQHRGANYFRQTTLPRENWRTRNDLAPQLAEFDLRYASQDYETAAVVLQEIDASYLALWGYYTLIIERRSSLIDRLIDPLLQELNQSRLAQALRAVGEMERAIDHAQKVLELGQARGERGAISAHLSNLGLIYYESGETQKAIEHYLRALETGPLWGEATQAPTLNNLGNAYADLGEIEKAISCYAQALKIHRSSHDRVNEGICLGNLGRAHMDLGETLEATQYYQQSFEIAREINNRSWQAMGNYYLGIAQLGSGKYEEAIACLVEALQIAEEIADRRISSRILYCLGESYYHSGNLVEAKGKYQEGLSLNFPTTKFSCAVKLGILSLEQGNSDQAGGYFGQGIDLCHMLLEKTPTLYDALYFIALAQLGLGRFEESLATYRRAISICLARGIIKGALRDVYLLQRAAPHTMGLAQVIQLLSEALDKGKGVKERD